MTIQKQMATGIVWMVGARLMDRGFGIVSTLILARLLIPEDFGLVAMATAIAGLLDLLGAFNFDLALIQRKDATRRHYDTIWTFNLLFGLFCGLALVVLADPAATFYREPRLQAVMYALAVAYVVGGLTNVGIVDFRKELRFRDEFKFILWRRLFTFVITIGCAFWFRSYWALVAGVLGGRVISVVLSFTMSDYKPSFTLSASRELFHYSKWLLLNNTLFFLLNTGPNFVIGRISGAAALGIYTVAYEVSNLPTTELVAPINRATFPGFAKMGSADDIARSFLKLLGMTTLLILPVGVGLAVVAEPLVLTVLGQKWSDAIPLMQLLAIYGAIVSMQSNNGIIWMVLGRPRDITLFTFAFLAILFPALYFLIGQFGVLGSGIAYLATQVLFTPASMWNTKRLLHLRWKDIIYVAWRPVIGVAIMYVGVSVFDHKISGTEPMLRLLADSLFGSILYATAVLTMWYFANRPSGAETFCMEKLATYVSRKA